MGPYPLLVSLRHYTAAHKLDRDLGVALDYPAVRAYLHHSLGLLQTGLYRGLKVFVLLEVFVEPLHEGYSVVETLRGVVYQEALHLCPLPDQLGLEFYLVKLIALFIDHKFQEFNRSCINIYTIQKILTLQTNFDDPSKDPRLLRSILKSNIKS